MSTVRTNYSGFILIIAFLNVVVGLDAGGFPPYFNVAVWRIMYFAIAAMLVLFYFVREQRWFLWSCAMITGTGFLRGLCYYLSDRIIAPLAIDINVIILTWLFYRSMVMSFPERRAK